jgi:hypothetical protein
MTPEKRVFHWNPPGTVEVARYRFPPWLSACPLADKEFSLSAAGAKRLSDDIRYFLITVGQDDGDERVG